MKGMNVTLSFIIFLILILVIGLIILLWHYRGFGLFERGMKNVTHGLIENASGGIIQP